MTLSINPYINQQIQLERSYHSQLLNYFNPLITALMNYVSTENNYNRNLVGINNVYLNWKTQYWKLIERVNGANAIAITKLVSDNVLDNYTPTIISPSQSHNLASGLNIVTENASHVIKGRFLELIPVGFIGGAYTLFNDEATADDMIRRSNYSLEMTVQDAITTGVVQTIFLIGKSFGMTEYLADNQHDDKVRATHIKYFNNKTWYKFNEPSPVGHPGDERNCRCFITKLR